MRIRYLTESISAYIGLSLCLLAFAFGAEKNMDRVDHHNVKGMIEKYLAENPEIMNASKDKDIVIFLGNTGAGKSTIINYLSGKRLKVNDMEDIVLDNPQDLSAMAIGEGSESETFLPAFVQVGDVLFYDSPGFKDTRGTARSLVNACFIKRIIENARSVKVVFIAGMDQITTDRGNSFKSLLSNVKQLIPHKNLENFSALVITKSHVNSHGLSAFINAKLTSTQEHDLYLLYSWMENQRIGQMSRPRDSVIGSEDRDFILNLIRNIHAEKIEHVNIGVIYDPNEQRHIRDIYDAEIGDIIGKLIAQNAQLLPTLDRGALGQKENYIRNDFRPAIYKALEESPLINLLRPISESLYQASWQQYDQLLTLRLEAIVGQIHAQMKEIEKKEEELRRLQAERALKAEEDLRIQAENTLRVAQERARKAEAELQAIRAAEEAKRQAQVAAKRQQEEAERTRIREEQARRLAEEKKQSEERSSRAEREGNYQRIHACPAGGTHDYYCYETKKGMTGQFWADFHFCRKCPGGATTHRELNKSYRTPYESFMGN